MVSVEHGQAAKVVGSAAVAGSDRVERIADDASEMINE